MAWANLTETSFEEVLDRENAEFAAAIERPAFKEAVRAFLEKRQPQFHPV
jgi:enoyl-CoA hydratase/carnithine racemase